MAAQIQLIAIDAAKTSYLVEIMNSMGQTTVEWMDEPMIEFIDPAFLNRWRESVATEKAAQANIDEATQDSIDEATEVEGNKNYSERLTKCDHCDAVIKRGDHMKDHIRIHHSATKDEYSCPLCTSKSGYRSNWTQHMIKKHNWSSKKARQNADKNLRVVPNAENDKKAKRKRKARDELKGVAKKMHLENGNSVSENVVEEFLSSLHDPLQASLNEGYNPLQFEPQDPGFGKLSYY